VVGEGVSASGTEAFRWTQTTGMVGLGDLPGGNFNSNAYAVSANGQVVVGQSSSTASASSGAEAFRWTEATGMVGLGALPSNDFTSYATAVSADGSIIVGASVPESGLPEAFIWDAYNGMRNLHDLLMDEFGLGPSLVGWRLRDTRGISADGRTIVGIGINPNGDTEGWLAQLDASPVPELPTFLTFSTGLGALGILAWGGRRGK